MKILIIPSGEDFKNKDATAVIHTMEVVNHLAKNNLITLFALTSNIKASPKNDQQNLKINYLPYYNNFILRSCFRYFILIFYFLFMFLKINADVIYGRFGSLTFSSLMAAKLAKKKYVVEVNGLKINELKSVKAKSKILNFKIQLVKILEKFTYKYSDKIIAVSLSIKKELNRIYHIPLSKIEVVPNGANTELFKPIQNAKKKLGLNKNYKYIGFVGNLAYWQGVEYLVKAAKKVIKKENKVKFLIVGEGKEKNKLEILVDELNLRKKFIFTGKVKYSEVPIYINAFDVCIAPFKKNRFASPIKIFEYMACRKLIVASKISDIQKIKESKKFILFFKPENYNDLADKIIFALNNDPEKVNVMAKFGRIQALSCYNWKITARKIENILNSQIY